MFLVHINSVWINVPSQCMQMMLLFTFYLFIFIFQKAIWTFPEFASIDTNNGLKSRLDMKDNRKCITISLSTSIGNHCFVGIGVNSGSVYRKDSYIIRLSTIIDTNRLVINLKKSKTQCMLCGTANCFTPTESLKVAIRGKVIDSNNVVKTKQHLQF